MDANKFGCFVADRRKELNMTQKDLAAKIQVTDKAVSKWERGLGLPDINSIEDLANALDVSIVELMKAERKTEVVSADETEKAVMGVLDIAGQEVQTRHKTFIVIFAVTAFLCTLAEMLFNIDWSAQNLAMTAKIPYTAIIPGIEMVIYAIICKVRGEKSNGFFAIGFCIIFIPIILIMGAFLILCITTG
ncbi:MAG: helix-turn-helix domain-containing protein [Lachnospiraceae bacterium]